MAQLPALIIFVLNESEAETITGVAVQKYRRREKMRRQNWLGDGIRRRHYYAVDPKGRSWQGVT